MCLDRDHSPKDIVDKFSKVIKVSKAHGSLAVIQLTHAGRQTAEFIASEPVSSSEGECKPLGGG